MRAIWKGNISFSLISIPIKIYTATEPKEIQFHNLCPVCHTPIRYKRWCPTCNKEVKWEDVVKGYKLTEERWVVLEEKELEKIKISTTKMVEIQEFVDASQIDPIYFQKTYYIVPDEGGQKAYSLFVETLRLANKAAIGRVVIKNKEYLVAVRAFKKGLAMHILYYLGEVRDVDKFSELKELVVVSKEELELAKLLIGKLTTSEFKIEEFKDRYTEALKELIKAKAEGKEFKVGKEKPVAEAKSLMEALKASVERVEKIKKKAEAK
jgi:DNA end-binding protein Ku